MELINHQFITFFPKEQAHKLCELAIIKTFQHDQVIFDEGETSDFLYLVLEGKVEFRKSQSYEQFQIISAACANDFFGEFGVLDGSPRSAQAVVSQTAVLAKISRTNLMEILDNTESSVILKLFHYIIQRLRITTEEYVKQLAYKDKMVLVGEMVNSIMHDFKSPLSGINLASEMIKQFHHDPETIEWCNLMNIQTQRMTLMASDLLDFAKGNNILNKSTLNIKKSLEKFIELNKIYFNDANINVKVECPSELMICGDEQKLLRVWQNLATNAVEAFQDQKGEITITVKKVMTTDLNEGVHIQFYDNGKGIAQDVLPTIFDPFVTFGKKKGTGLGTAIIKSIIEAHGGKISVSSEPNQGTTFDIYLPLETE
jgi:signal transduction histidine kinase